MRLSVCVEMVFDDHVFTDRVARVSYSGLEYFEFWGWSNKDLEAIKAVAEAKGVKASVFCVEGGSLVDPGNREKYVRAVEDAVKAAGILGVKTLITTVGNELPGIPREDQHASIVDGLKAAAPIVEAAGITLVVEPLNTLVDHKGYYLFSSDEGFAIIDEVGSGNVKLLYDIYHQQIMEGNIIPTILRNIDRIGHFHVADNPGRNEPGTGELDYGNIFKAIRETGYLGFVGLEYRPIAKASETLDRVKAIFG